jgi:hypothetical protein
MSALSSRTERARRGGSRLLVGSANQPLDRQPTVTAEAAGEEPPPAGGSSPTTGRRWSGGPVGNLKACAGGIWADADETWAAVENRPVVPLLASAT